MIEWIALVGALALAFLMGSNLAIWHERRQPVDVRLMLFHMTLCAACFTVVIFTD